MATLNAASVSLLNEQTGDCDKNYINDGLADDDSWVENTSEGEEEDIVGNLSPSSLTGSIDSEEKSGYNFHAIDFTLHTIIEESCDDSDLEFCYNKSNDSFENANQENGLSPMDMERYFVFGFEDQDASNNGLEDSSSEIFSDLSDGEQESTATKKEDECQVQFDLSSSRLEKYFLSEFMGFSAENKSDSSVGSDSEGKPSPSQRKKKLRARRTPRSNHSSFDNLLIETTENVEQSNESLDSSESDLETFQKEALSSDKDNTNSGKRRKTYRRRELTEPTSTSSLESWKNNKPSMSALTPSKSKGESKIERSELKKDQSIRPLDRTDSFNNWSSDEETNLMMYKMRQFFKTLIAVKTNNVNTNNCCVPTQDQKVICKNKAIKFPYFESELVRLMKTVPGINNKQLREIVEYLSSEDAWSDSNDSSDFNSPNVEICKNEKQSEDSAIYPANKDISYLSESVSTDNRSGFLETQTALMYTNLFESFMTRKSNLNSREMLVDINKYDEKQQLLVNIWQHIGQKLVDLMRQENMGVGCAAIQNTEKITEISNFNVEKVRPENNHKSEDSNLVPDNEEHNSLPRSKSHDLLLGTTNKTWHYSNSAMNENSGDISDCDRFSWRGSFESALFAPGDSRNKLLSSSQEDGSHVSQWSLLKRGSVDNLWCTNLQNRKHLDRVQSCGNILGSRETKCIEIQKKWLSTYAPNKTDEKSSLPRKTRQNLYTNSLPVLQTNQDDAITSTSELNTIDVQSNVKSARYRPSSVQPKIPFTPSAVKRSENVLREEPQYSNCLHKRFTSSTSLGDFSLSELNSNITNSPVLQRKSIYKSNTINFRGRSESLSSVCSDCCYEHVKVKGHVKFGMQYNYKINALEIHVAQCKDLASVSSKRCKSNPYVKVYILPDISKCGKRKTKVKKQTLNPVFNETLRFHVPISKLKNRSIWLTVWNSDLLGRNDFLGEVIVDLEDKVFDKPQSQWYALQQKDGLIEDSKFRGNLIVALKFVPNEMPKEASGKVGNVNPFTTGKLHVLVKEAKFANRNVACDTFCKSYLLPIRSKSTKQKTHVIKKSLNPVWNFTFVYENLTMNELSKRALELTVWDHDRLISNQFIGGVRFSLGTGMYGNEVSTMESNDKEIFLWREMMNRPNFWVEESVKLRSNLNEKYEENIESREVK